MRSNRVPGLHSILKVARYSLSAIFVGVLAGCQAVTITNDSTEKGTEPELAEDSASIFPKGANGILEAGTTQSDPDRSGHDYIAANGSYRVRFPSRPQERDTQTHAAFLEDGDRFYFVRGDRLEPARSPASLAQAQEYLDLVLPGIAKQFGGETLSYRETFSWQGYPARRIAFANDLGIQYAVRIIFDPRYQRLFVLAFGTTEDNLAIPEVQSFFDSFAIAPSPDRLFDRDRVAGQSDRKSEDNVGTGIPPADNL